MSRRSASISPAPPKRRSSSSSTGSSYRAPGRAASGDRARLVQQREMDKGATHALVTRSNPVQPSQTYLADASGQAARLGRGECARCVASLCALSRQPCEADVRHASPGRTARRSITGCSRPSWRPGKRYPVFFYVYGGPHGRQVTDAWSARCRCTNLWSTRAGSSSRSTIAAPTAAAPVRECDLSRDGRRRGRGPAGGRRMAEEAAVRRSVASSR